MSDFTFLVLLLQFRRASSFQLCVFTIVNQNSKSDSVNESYRWMVKRKLEEYSVTLKKEEKEDDEIWIKLVLVSYRIFIYLSK